MILRETEFISKLKAEKCKYCLAKWRKLPPYNKGTDNTMHPFIHPMTGDIHLLQLLWSFSKCLARKKCALKTTSLKRSSGILRRRVFVVPKIHRKKKQGKELRLFRDIEARWARSSITTNG